ncbi:murein hydrolase activator EnvC family protein [Bradyrhizobium lablabi]|uniref:murein hydrolase activator EnvC family protein n=1 Tax=Bradyrhizobium lablabi TaxID=722472 RepID=UPI00090C12E6|nr:peptidoglycan DD-metalloendopeptidase family protein [Bradyrhizobium lablabi]SHL33516.1 Septal ring factor EnvC, activator of murein hydrolases AmiA and AmiB [Bradyrhizobium lablabi]
MHSLPDIYPRPDAASRRRPLVLLSAGLLSLISLLSLTSLAVAPAAAQVAAPSPQAAAVSPDIIKQREQELEAAREQQRKTTELQQKLKADIAAIGQDRSKLNQQLIDIAAGVRGVETRIVDAEARLRPLDAREQQIRASLDSRRSEIVEVLAALQRAGRRTPPALLVRPEDALQSLRTAMLLGSAVPELRGRAEKLSSDLGELVALRKTIATERDALARDRDRSKDDQVRLAALVDERQRQQSAIEKDMEAEGARAITLSKQVDSLQGLIAKMEQDVKSAAKAAATASLQGAPNGKPNPGALKDPARLSPAIAFASAKGLLAFPVNGSKIRDFGGSDGAGGVEKGISLASRAGAQVTTPCDGWVVYAGPFRSYGQLLILNAGGGYHVLIAGMERISVNIGQFVLTGEPVATMGSTSLVASILATTASQPVLYVEFRKDGTPIDPGPWWAANEGEKVRG